MSELVWNEAGLRELLRSPAGPIARDLARRVNNATTQAKRNASTPRGSTVPGITGPSVDTGRLRSSISWRIGEDGEGVYGDFGTSVIYGYYLETGLRNGVKYPFLVPAIPAARP